VGAGGSSGEGRIASVVGASILIVTQRGQNVCAVHRANAGIISAEVTIITSRGGGEDASDGGVASGEGAQIAGVEGRAIVGGVSAVVVCISYGNTEIIGTEVCVIARRRRGGELTVSGIFIARLRRASGTGGATAANVGA